MKHTNLIAAHMILAAALVLVPSASFAQKGKIVKNVVKSATGKAPVTLAEGASNAGRNLKASFGSSTSVVENMGRGVISVPGTPANPAVNTPSIHVPAIGTNPGLETLNTTRRTASVPLVSTPLVDRKIMEAGRANNPEFEIREGGLPRGSTEFTLPTATAGGGRKPPVTPTVLAAEMPELPGGNGPSATPDMDPQIKIIPLKTEDEVLILPTDMQNLIKTMTQNAMKTIKDFDSPEGITFIETLFKGVPTYSRLATANYLQTLGVDVSTIVKASGNYPSILKKFLPMASDPGLLSEDLFYHSHYNEETLPILLDHSGLRQINSFLFTFIREQKFELADNLIDNYGADINEVLQLFFYYELNVNEEAMAAMLQFFADRNADFNQVFDEYGAPMAIHKAAYHGYAEMIPFLKEYGADVNAQDAQGNTPLHIAITSPEESRFVVIDALYQAGADPAIENNAGLNAWQQIQDELSHTYRWSERYQHLKDMQELLKPLKPKKTKYFRHPVAF